MQVQNSTYAYKYPLSYNQFMLRGSSLKITQWVYGIVVYTGQETKIKQNDNKKSKLKKSKMEKQMNMQILGIFILQFLLACVGAAMSQVFDQNNTDKAYYLAIESEIKEGSYWLQ